MEYENLGVFSNCWSLLISAEPVDHDIETRLCVKTRGSYQFWHCEYGNYLCCIQPGCFLTPYIISRKTLPQCSTAFDFKLITSVPVSSATVGMPPEDFRVASQVTFSKGI